MIFPGMGLLLGDLYGLWKTTIVKKMADIIIRFVDYRTPNGASKYVTCASI